MGEVNNNSFRTDYLAKNAFAKSVAVEIRWWGSDWGVHAVSPCRSTRDAIGRITGSINRWAECKWTTRSSAPSTSYAARGAESIRRTDSRSHTLWESRSRIAL